MKSVWPAEPRELANSEEALQALDLPMVFREMSEKTGLGLGPPTPPPILYDKSPDPDYQPCDSWSMTATTPLGLQV